jgi:hypothetical protein
MSLLKMKDAVILGPSLITKTTAAATLIKPICVLVIPSDLVYGMWRTLLWWTRSAWPRHSKGSKGSPWTVSMNGVRSTRTSVGFRFRMLERKS